MNEEVSKCKVMEKDANSDLNDAEKKLTELKSRLECLMQIVWGSKNVDSSDVLVAAKELQSLCEWAAQKHDILPQDARLFFQLQELQNIQQNLTDGLKQEENNVAPLSAELAVQPEDEKSSPKNLSSSDAIMNCHPQENGWGALSHQNYSMNERISPPQAFSGSPSSSTFFTSPLPDNDREKIAQNSVADCLRVNTQQAMKVKDEDVLRFLSNGLDSLLNSNEEMKQYLASSAATRTESSASSSTIGMLLSPSSDTQDLLSSDIEDSESNIDEKALNVLSRPFSEACDLLMDEIRMDSRPASGVKSPQSSEMNFLSREEVLEQVSPKGNKPSKETATELFKYVSDKDLSSFMERKSTSLKTITDSKSDLLNILDIPMLPEPANSNTSSGKNNTVEGIFGNDHDSLSQPSAVARNLGLSDCPKVVDHDRHSQNPNSGVDERVPSPNYGVGAGSSSEKNAEPVLIDLLTSDDYLPTPNDEKVERCLTPCSLHCMKPAGSELTLLETKSDRPTEVVAVTKASKDPLDVCMFAIRNLYDNLRAKENELLKMSVIQNDQKHIESLQTVILDFHEEITALKSKLETLEKENSSLKEQVLELEEAENDTRLKAQKLEQKLSFLQEKDAHAQDEIYRLKKHAKTASEKLSEKDLVANELRSQVAHLESLIRKYEERIADFEAKENEQRREERANVVTSEKGSQTYPLMTKFDRNNSNDCFQSENALYDEASKSFQDPRAKTESTGTDLEQTEVNEKETTHAEDQYVITIQDGEMLKEFNDRLLALMHEDKNLQEQIQNVDQINLTLWTKLQNMESNIGAKEEKLEATDDSRSLLFSDSGKDSASEAFKPTEKAEKVQKEWKETERLLISDLKTLAFQKDELVEKIEKLESEKTKFEQQVSLQQAELNELKEKNQTEVARLRAEQETKCATLQQKVNQLISEEQNLLKMIKNLKTDRGNKSQTENELERLKCSYIQLQLELSHSREEKRKMEQNYKLRIDECVGKHKDEETCLMKELEQLRQEKLKCDETIKEHQLQQQRLASELGTKELELRQARESYEKSLADINRRHQSVETELKNELMKLEEKTFMATSALMEERLRVEKELQENIKQLREKEESYIHKISNMEKNMTKLQEELHKVTRASNVDDSVIQGSSGSLKQDRATTASPGHPKSNIILDRYVNARPISEPDPKQFSRDVARFVPAASSKIKTAKEENVDDLRIQVRELQAQLEKIAEEESSPAVTPAAHVGWQKESVYDEADERVAEWRKPYSNQRTGYQPINENKNPARHQYKSGKEKYQSERSLIEENEYDEILPRPTNFHLIQQVGPDALLVGWNYVNPSFLDGFEIYLDNRLHERIYIPDRTKALVSGLNLRRSFTLSIRALSHYGQLSEPASLELTCQPKSEFIEEEDEYSDTESSRQRPYSMEW